MAGVPKSTSLTFIAKTQEQARDLIDRYGQYFDDVRYRVGDVKGDFARARNAVLKTVETDYWFWIDTDDEIVNPQNIYDLIQLDADAVYLPYEYAYNAQGECIALQWRERLVKTDHPFKWLGAVHETLVSPGTPKLERSSLVIIKHAKSQEEHTVSSARNHKILAKEYTQEPRDPRVTHYLALSYFNLKKYEEAIELFREHVKTSGWDEERFRSIFYISQAWSLLKQPDKAKSAALEAVGVLPTRPEGYVLLADAAFDMGNFEETLFWLRVAGETTPPEATLSVIDPTYYGYRAEMLAALAYLHLGKVKEAFAQLQSVLKKSPDFKTAKNMYPLFASSYYEQEAVDRIRYLYEYLKNDPGANVRKLLESLPPDLFADVRLNPLRAEAYPNKKWGPQSIVFFCGASAEAWGPERLSTGVGGSEEAVIYLSRELAKLGWEVHVYGDREEELQDGPVTYHPWTLLNPTDEFNVFVAWRTPQLANGVKAKLVLADLHDVLPDNLLLGATYVDKFMVKSRWQRSLYSGLPGDRFAVVSNGINRKDFHKAEKRPFSAGYFSSYDRGLECLLDLWPHIRAKCPQATLDIAYGWQGFDAMAKGRPEMAKFKLRMLGKLSKLSKLGVSEHGRLSHAELHKLMACTQVWAYPTEFTETNCITALKAQEAGMHPVTTAVAALNETVVDGTVLKFDDIYSNPKAQEAFVTAMEMAFTHDWGSKPVPGVDWSEVALEWEKVLP